MSTTTLRSTITTQLLTRTLFRGVVLAALGVGGLTYAAIFMTSSALMNWGWLIYLVSFALITAGMLPYRKLVKQQINPRELRLMDDQTVLYLAKQKRLLNLPLEAVDSWEYIDTWNSYGVAVKLKPLLRRPVTIYLTKKESAPLHRGENNEELFFPYFSRHACEELMNWQIEYLISPSE